MLGCHSALVLAVAPNPCYTSGHKELGLPKEYGRG